MIVSINPEFLLFLINTDVPRFKEKTHHLKVQQISLEVKDNQEFLDHDSFLDCSEVFKEFNFEEVREIILNDTSRILGKLCDETISQLMDVVSESETLEQRYINTILSEIK